MTSTNSIDDKAHDTGAPIADKAAEFLQKIEKNRRGRLKFFFGAAPGVGKTFAMLQEAQEKRKAGLDVLIGWVDTHGRKDTAALLDGLEVLPRKHIRYQNFDYEEFDIDEVLKRRPALVVVDELAHTNAPTSRHAKRWQDIDELIAAGIDVWTAMNVQHLESLNGVVEKMTGVQVNETVPDRLFDEAYEVRLVDLPPNDLLARLRAGKIYIQETIDAALHGFFKKSNLHSLRELALRKMALRVAETDRIRGNTAPDRSAASALLLFIDRIENAEALVRECSRLAYSMQVPWHAVWIDSGTADENERGEINDAFKLAEELGGNAQIIESLSVSSALITYLRTKGLHTLVTTNSAIGWRLRRKLISSVESLHLMTISITPHQGSPKKDSLQKWAAEFVVDGWWQSVLSVLLLTFGLSFFDKSVTSDTIALFYMFPTIFIALRYGRGPAALAVFLSAFVFDIYFIEPRMSLKVANFNYIVLLAAMLCVGLGTGNLIAKLKKMSVASAHRSAQMQMLLSMSKELGRALSLDDIAESLHNHMSSSRYKVSTELWECLEDPATLNPVGKHTAQVDQAISMWVVEHAEEAGCGTHTLASSRYLYLPLKGSIRTRGVLVFIADEQDTLHHIEFKRLARAISDLVAQAIERIHYVEVSQKTVVEMEAQRFRHMLISELSHDLRTPLTVLSASTESLNRSLLQKNLPEATQSSEILENISKMTRLADNLLEMARLQSGAVQLNSDWLPIDELFGSALGAVPSALLNQFKIYTSIEPNCPYLFADARLINRVLVNLLDNAMKYCAPGSTIRLEAKASGSKIMLSVSDNGPGLSDDASHLFDPFRRGTRESCVFGIGLGLSISKMIARVHEGQLIATNNPEAGAKFTLVMPRKEMPELLPDDELEEE